MSDINEIEHKYMKEEQAYLQKCFEGQDDRWAQWTDAQDQKREAFQEKIEEKVERILGAFEAKREVDTMVLGKIGEMARSLEAMRLDNEARWVDFASVKVHVEDVLSLMQKHNIPKMHADLQSAFGTLRVHGQRLDNLENRPGEGALAFLKWVGIAFGGAVIGYIAKLFFK